MGWRGIAVAYRAQYEKVCGRGQLVSGHVTRVALADVVQGHAKGSVEAEFNHCASLGAGMPPVESISLPSQTVMGIPLDRVAWGCSPDRL